MTICSLVQDFSTPSMGSKGELGVERETWMKIPLWTLASQRLRFSKLSMTSGDHRSPQRYHYLINSQSRLIIFFLLYHPICQMQLNYDLLSSWVQSGGKHNGSSRSNGAQRTLLEGSCPDATQSGSPNLPQNAVEQRDIPAVWLNPAHGLTCLNVWEVQVFALTSSLKSSLKSLKNTVFGFNSKEEQRFCPHPSIDTYDYTSKGYLTEPVVLHSHSLLYPVPQDFSASSLAVLQHHIYSLLQMGKAPVFQSGFWCS